MKASPLALRIGRRLQGMGRLPEGITPEMCRLQRTYAGHWQRSEGVWSWYFRYIGQGGKEVHGPEIGSQWTASEVVRWPEWHIYHGSIDPPTVAQPTKGGKP